MPKAESVKYRATRARSGVQPQLRTYLDLAVGAREGWISRGQFPAVGSDDEVGDDEDGGGAVQEDMTDVDGGCRQKAARALDPGSQATANRAEGTMPATRLSNLLTCSLSWRV